MKIIVYILILLLIPFAMESYAENSLYHTEAKLEWSQHNFGMVNGTGTVKIILTDFDAPNIPTYIDRVTVFVYSDSFPEGINLTLYETEKNSGIFERIFSLSDTRSAPSVLFTSEGDTAIVEYLDDTLPSDHEFSEIQLRETTLIGLLGYPIERLPVTNPRIVDLDGNRLDFPILGGQILLQSDIASQQDTPQEFIWLAQTVDSQKRVQSLSWINGTINPQSSFSPSTSWIPQSVGNYRTTFFVWESIDNPTALSPPVELEFTIVNSRSVVYSHPFGSSENKNYNVDPIYIENPNTGELVLNIDAMQKVIEILDYCETPDDGFDMLLEYSNGTHTIDNDTCKWQKIK